MKSLLTLINSLRGVLALALLLASLACADSPNEAPTSAMPRVIRLAEILEPQNTQLSHRKAIEGIEPLPGGLHFHERFDERVYGKWYSARALRGSQDLGVLTQELSEGGRDDTLGLAVHPTTLGAVLFLPSKPIHAYEISIWSRPLEEGAEASVRCMSLSGNPGSPGSVDFKAAKMFSAAINSAPTTLEKLHTDKNAFTQHKAVLTSTRSRRGLMIYLDSRGGPSLFDDLKVRRLHPLEEFLESRMHPGESFEAPWRRKITLDESTRDCLVAPPPSSFRWSLTIPPRAVLEFGSAFLAPHSLGTSESTPVPGIEVWVDGALVRRVDESTPGDRSFEDHRVDLSSHDGQQVELELRTTGPDQSVVLLAHPILRILETTTDQRSVVLISLDTLRADHLSCYGYDKDTSPNIDALAQEGTRFERFRSVASFTLPTHATLLSGQHPLVHGVRQPTDHIDPERTPILSDVLRREGYLTAAFTGGGFVDPEFGFDAGFDRYETGDPASQSAPRRSRHVAQRSQSSTRMEDVLTWIEDHADSPFFLFVHTYLVHGYEPLPEYRQVFDADCTERLDMYPHLVIADHNAGNVNIPRAEHMEHLYDATIAQADERVVKAIVETIEAAGLDSRTIVALTSDHGEEFLDHGKLGHGQILYEELVRVPMILKGPGIPRGHVIDADVSMEGLAPTLRELSSLDSDPRAPYPSLFSDEFPPTLGDVLFTGARPISSIVHGGKKLVLFPAAEGSGDRRLELYDLIQDPTEVRDLSIESSELAGKMKSHWKGLSQRLEAARATLETAGDSERELSPDLIRRLKELGYLDD